MAKNFAVYKCGLQKITYNNTVNLIYLQNILFKQVQIRIVKLNN